MLAEYSPIFNKVSLSLYNKLNEVKSFQRRQQLTTLSHVTTVCGLLYPSDQEKELKLIGYSDSDFANDSLSRLSCTGYVITQLSAILDWTSLTPKTIATTTEAEWIALSASTRYAEYLRGFANELGLNTGRVTWWWENASTVITSTTPGHTGRTRHLDVKLKKTHVRWSWTESSISSTFLPISWRQLD